MLNFTLAACQPCLGEKADASREANLAGSAFVTKCTYGSKQDMCGHVLFKIFRTVYGAMAGSYSGAIGSARKTPQICTTTRVKRFHIREIAQGITVIHRYEPYLSVFDSYGPYQAMAHGTRQGTIPKSVVQCTRTKPHETSGPARYAGYGCMTCTSEKARALTVASRHT